MIKLTGDTPRYRIVIRGECGRLLATLVDNVQAVTSQNGNTCLVVLVRDGPGFRRLMDQLQDLAVHLVSLQDLDHDKNHAIALGADERLAG